MRVIATNIAHLTSITIPYILPSTEKLIKLVYVMSYESEGK